MCVSVCVCVCICVLVQGGGRKPTVQEKDWSLKKFGFFLKSYGILAENALAVTVPWMCRYQRASVRHVGGPRLAPIPPSPTALPGPMPVASPHI